MVFILAIVGSTQNSFLQSVLGVSQQKPNLASAYSQLTIFVSLRRTLLLFRPLADIRLLSDVRRLTFDHSGTLFLTPHVGGAKLPAAGLNQRLLPRKSQPLFFHLSPSSFAALFIARLMRPTSFGPMILWVRRMTGTGSVRPVSLNSRPLVCRFLPALY